MEQARHEVREVERFLYWAVGTAIEEQDVKSARDALRLAVGLRRKLDVFKVR